MILKGIWLLGLAAILAPAAQPSADRPLFEDSEKEAAMRYWADAGRYRERLPEGADTNGPSQVRLTVAGSVWLREYNRLRGLKVPPTVTAKPQNAEQRAWQQWIDAKIEFDRWAAMEIAKDANARVGVKESKFDDKTLPKSKPADPGRAPEALIRFAGVPPIFAEAVVPMVHEVTFHDGTVISLGDNRRMRKDYAYYRFEKGVATGGIAVKDLPESELASLCKKAGITEDELRVMKAVSLLEGGFDSVNTYDTGFVSVGFIQFACLKDGGNSLGALLKRYKESDPKNFQRDFTRFGIDVTDDAKLACLDLKSGEELRGGDAARTIIEDRRLIAVFQYNGLKSAEYNAMQLRSAKEQFFPADDTITLNVNGQVLTGRVSDIFRSEAALATLMDRKVNTGKLEPLSSILQQYASANQIGSLEDLRQFEFDIVADLQYRRNYLADSGLSQPAASRSKTLGARSGSRSTRGKRGGGSDDPNP